MAYIPAANRYVAVTFTFPLVSSPYNSSITSANDFSSNTVWQIYDCAHPWSCSLATNFQAYTYGTNSVPYGWYSTNILPSSISGYTAHIYASGNWNGGTSLDAAGVYTPTAFPLTFHF